MGKHLFKVLLAGSHDKKKELLIRHTTSSFDPNKNFSSSGVNFAIVDMNLHNGVSAKLQLWDLRLQERFRRVLPLYCQGSSGALLFFDLDDPPTFYQLNEILGLIRKNTRNIPIILCGANWDHTIPEDILFEAKDLTEFISESKLDGFLNINIRTGYNINMMFETITKLMIQSKQN